MDKKAAVQWELRNRIKDSSKEHVLSKHPIRMLPKNLIDTLVKSGVERIAMVSYGMKSTIESGFDLLASLCRGMEIVECDTECSFYT